MKIPVKINDPSDYAAGTHTARIVEKPVWLVEIVMPKALMSDIRTGSIELEDQDIDLADLDDAYQQDLDKEEFKQDEQQQQQSQAPAFPAI
jgi:hypothetical protein